MKSSRFLNEVRIAVGIFSFLISIQTISASDPTRNFDIFDSLFMGVKKATAGSFLRFPIVSIRTLKQSAAWEEPHPKSALHYLKQAFKKGGTRQLYRGSFFYSSEMILRETYKYSLLFHVFPKYFDKYIPRHYQGPLAYKIYSGWFLAFIDTTVGTPFSNARNLMITSKENKPVLQLFDEIEGTWRKKIYRGYVAKLSRGIVFYNTFFSTDFYLKNQAAIYKGSNDFTLNETIMISGAIGTFTTMMLTPFEILVVLLQKENAMVDRGLLKNMYSIYKAGGIRTTYAGFSLHIAQRLLGSTISSILLHIEEKKFKYKD